MKTDYITVQYRPQSLMENLVTSLIKLYLVHAWCMSVWCMCVWCIRFVCACVWCVRVWCVQKPTQTHVYGSTLRKNILFVKTNIPSPTTQHCRVARFPRRNKISAALPNKRVRVHFACKACCCRLSLKRLLGGEPLYLSYRGEPPRSHNKGSDDSSGPGGFLLYFFYPPP